MKALVVEARDALVVTDLPDPEPADHEVLIAPERCGLCATDIKILEGRMPANVVLYPCLLGHEYSGIVVSVGTSVTSFEEGDRVVGEGRIPCGRCDRCLERRTNLCRHFDHVGFGPKGACAELVAVPDRIVHRLPDGVSFDAGAVIEPAACVVRAFDRLHHHRGKRLAVVGIGSLGAIALQLAASLDLDEVVAFGVRPAELELAEALGAAPAVKVDEGSLGATEWSSTFDLVLEAAGDRSATALAFELAEPGGRVVLLGTTGLPAPPGADDIIVRKELTVRGSLSYTSDDYVHTLGLVQHGRLDLDAVVTSRYPLAAAPEALASLKDASRRDTKIVVEPTA